jgi:hypothetical protein
MGGVEWNPDIQVLRNRITAWHLQLRKLRGCRVGSQYLVRIILSTDLPPGSFTVSLLSAVVAQRANFKAYRLAKKDHVSSRESWLQTLARSKSQDDGNTAIWNPPNDPLIYFTAFY